MRLPLGRALRLIAAPLVALLLLATGTVATARAAEAPRQANAVEAADDDAWTFTTGNGRRLDVQNGNTGDGVFVVANNTPGTTRTGGWSRSATASSRSPTPSPASA
ncbi:hypothetical protein ACFQ60_46035 [Streptomyces zhihengii]